MKKIKHILVILALCISFGSSPVFANDILDISVTQSQWVGKNLGNSSNSVTKNAEKKNSHLKYVGWNNQYKVSKTGKDGIRNFLFRVAKDIKNLFFVIAWVIFLILILKLLASEKTEDEVWNFKKWIIWVSLWLLVTQLSYSFTNILYQNEVTQGLGVDLNEYLIQPLISFIETAAAFVFLTMMIIAFYKMVTANGNEDQVKQGKMTVLYALIWFIVLKFAKTIVIATNGKLNCNINIVTTDRNDCIRNNDIPGLAWIITEIINWANGFVGIIVVVLIIYVWAKVLFSAGNEDTLKQAKSTVLYIFIGIAILVMNYLILTFFLIPETSIT